MVAGAYEQLHSYLAGTVNHATKNKMAKLLTHDYLVELACIARCTSGTEREEGLRS